MFLSLLRWVLTAAHCLEKQRDVFVLGGIDKHGKFYGRERVNTSNQHIHPKYDALTLANDIGKELDGWTIALQKPNICCICLYIALISLRGPIPPNPFMAPAQLPNDCGNVLDNQAAVAAGRGIISTNGTLDRRLRYAALQTAPRHICHKVANPNLQPTSLICAISKSGQYVYNGDSGGPLIRQRDSTLIGVASFVRKMVNTEIEGNFVVNQFFQNIHFHFNWISNITGLELPACSRPFPVFSSWEGIRIRKINPDAFRQ